MASHVNFQFSLLDEVFPCCYIFMTKYFDFCIWFFNRIRFLVVVCPHWFSAQHNRFTNLFDFNIAKIQIFSLFVLSLSFGLLFFSFFDLYKAAIVIVCKFFSFTILQHRCFHFLFSLLCWLVSNIHEAIISILLIVYEHILAIMPINNRSIMKTEKKTYAHCFHREHKFPEFHELFEIAFGMQKLFQVFSSFDMFTMLLFNCLSGFGWFSRALFYFTCAVCNPYNRTFIFISN